MTKRRLATVVVLLAVVTVLAPASGAPTRYGDLTFPQDESQHVDGWNYWWGAADLVTTSGNRYIVGLAFDSFWGVGATGHQVFPRQGPYRRSSIMTMDGPVEWGHPGEPFVRFVHQISTAVPGVDVPLSYVSRDSLDGLKVVGRWARTSLATPSYHLRIDNDAALVHPGTETVKLVVDLDVQMYEPPLLLGGTGRWWYSIPSSFGYPSRSYQYMQAARHLSGTLVLEQPDGSLLRERVASSGSSMVMVREYDASPEDLFAGLALAEATQLHPRYATYYSGGMPWDLIFVDLRNGAQLMVAILAFHDTPDGTLTPVAGADLPTYKTMATLRLASGESVALDDVIHVEHLGYRRTNGHVPTFGVQTTGLWTQDWDHRVTYGGGILTAGNGRKVRVPAFDLALVPRFSRDEPAVDDNGNGMRQRVPFDARGAYGGCPVDGFGWSELIINWYGKEDRDPWFSGGARPPVPKRCGPVAPARGLTATGDLTPPGAEAAPANTTFEGCSLFPGGETTCTYDATSVGGVAGYGATPSGWTIAITRRASGRPRQKVVLRSNAGFEYYACGTIHPGDRVVATIMPGSYVTAGNGGLCV